MKEIIITSILILLFGRVNFAQTKISQPNYRKDTVVVSIPLTMTANSAAESNAELNAYKLLYETTQKSNDKLEETTHWTFGIVIAFIVLILGSQFLYNWRLNKQEVENIKSEVEIKFQELSGTLDTQRENLFNSLKSDIEVAQKENRDQIKDRYQQLKEVNEKSIDFSKKEIDRGFKELKSEIEKHDAEIWLMKGVEANALASFIRTAEYKFDLNSELKYVLDDILSILMKVNEIHQIDFNKLEKLILEVKTKHAIKYDSIISKIEKNYKYKPIYTFEEQKLGGLFPSLFGSTKKIIKK